MLKILSILLFIPTLVFATESDLVESDSPWSFDIQYDYISLGDSYIDGSKKIITINLLLDSRLDENTTIHGDFYKKTTKSDYSALLSNSSVSEKGIRELYIESEVTPNTTIMVGKKAFNINNKKGIQDLGVAPLLPLLPLLTDECITNKSNEFNKCLGVKSAYIKSELSDDIQIEFLKTENKKLFSPTIKEYKARLKYSPNTLNYYLTIDKSVENESNANNIFLLNQRLNNKTSVELSLIEKKEANSLNQWFVKVKHTKNNNNCLPSNSLSATVYQSNLVNFGTTCVNLYSEPFPNINSRNFIHSNSLALGKVFAIDKLLINTELNHDISTYSETINLFNINPICTMQYPNPYCGSYTYSTHTTKKEIKTNSLSLMLEYPIKNGKITSSHLLTRTPYENSPFLFIAVPSQNTVNLFSSSSSIDVDYNFTKDISGRLGYQLFKSNSFLIPNLPYTYDVVTYSMKYKF
jgi:hypothetical protein